MTENKIIIKLYHGSNVIVEKPRFINGQRALDFGAGFYLTSSQKQATKWAKIVTRRKGKGIPTVNVYELDKESLVGLNILIFETANGDWLDYVVKNRRSNNSTDDYDMVIGPVANDNTLPVIDNYMAGVYTKEEAIKRLLPQNLTYQYAIKSAYPLSLLQIKKAIV